MGTCFLVHHEEVLGRGMASINSALAGIPRCRRRWAKGDRRITSVELYHSLKVWDRRRNTPQSAQNRSESLCAGLWAQCRVFWAWFGFALGPHPVRDRRFPAGSLKVFGVILAQPSHTYSDSRLFFATRVVASISSWVPWGFCGAAQLF